MKNFKKRVVSIFTTVMLTASIFQSASATLTFASGLSDSKVLDLKFDGNITDSSANNFTTTWHGDAATYVEGQSGKAIKFNGKNNYIDLGTSSLLQPQNLTVSLWVKPEAALTGESILVWNKPSGDYKGTGWYLSCLSDSCPLKLSTGVPGQYPQEAYVQGDRSAFFPVGQWTHIAVTFDSSTKTTAIYRNGMAQTVIGAQGGGISSNDTDNKYIGFNSPKYNGGFANLDMDEFEIYNKAATVDEVRDIYTSQGGQLGNIAQIDLNAISIPDNIRSSISLPTKGANGSTISWVSSKPSVISNTGVVTDPGTDTPVTLSATVVYGSTTLKKDFNITVKTSKYTGDTGVVKQFDMQDVNVTDPFYVNAYNKDVQYLLSLDPQKFLAGFKAVADGKDPGDPGVADQYGGLYGGWEASWSLIRGHSIGHYMSALAQAYRQTQVDDPATNAKIKAKLDAVVTGLKECQDKSTDGYVFASPRTHFDVIEGKAQGSSWVPWYTMHKIIAGLLDTYKYE